MWPCYILNLKVICVLCVHGCQDPGKPGKPGKHLKWENWAALPNHVSQEEAHYMQQLYPKIIKITKSK